LLARFDQFRNMLLLAQSYIEYGMRLGLFAVVRWCSPQAYFLGLLFAEYLQILCCVVGGAVRIAVLL
jgi:hypothetical protein